jgi:hypothetical protein
MCNRGSATACKNSTKESNRKKSKNRGVGGGDRKQESCSNLTTKVEFTPISPTPIRATRACGKKKGTRLRHLDYRERSVVGTLPQSCNADNEVRWSRIRNRMVCAQACKNSTKERLLATGKNQKIGGWGGGTESKNLALT